MTATRHFDRSITTMPPLPLYRQVREYIEKGIKSGQWTQDMKIPSENELVEILGISRMTINRAIRELTADGRLIRLQGVGTFVAPEKPQSALLEIRSIAYEINRRGGIHSSDVHLLAEETANPELASLLDIAAGSPVFHIILIHKDRGQPVQMADRYVNPAIAPDFLKQDFTRITPNEYLQRAAPVSEVEHVIEAILPDVKMQDLLKIKAEEPCLLLHRKTWAGKITATKSRFIYPGSRHRIGGRFKPVSDSHRMIA